MKTISLALFSAVILLGWTSLAAGALASLAGAPAAVNKPHRHQVPKKPVVEPAPLLSDAPCHLDGASHAAVPCSA